MGLNIKVGQVYDCVDLKEGNSQTHGKWAFFKVKAKKGYDTINVWATNPDALHAATAAKVLSIDNVELKSRLDDRSQKWFKDYNVTCTVERAESARQGAGSGFMSADDDLSDVFRF